MKKVKSFPRSLKVFCTSCLFLVSSLLVSTAMAESADSMLDSDWFQEKCQPQIVRYQADRTIILGMIIEDAWASPMTDQLPWPTAFRSQFARHACVSMEVSYLNQANPSKERFLCSVLDNDLPTEVKMFGNAGLAAEICAEPG